MPFSQQVSFPCELTLHRTSNGLRLFRQPIPQIAALHIGADTWTNRVLQANQVLPLAPAGESFHLKAQVRIEPGAKLIFGIRGATVTVTQKTLESGHPPAGVAGEIQDIEILVDRASIESFINGGEISSTRFFLSTANGLSLKSEGGAVQLKSLTVYPLKSAWSKN